MPEHARYAVASQIDKRATGQQFRQAADKPTGQEPDRKKCRKPNRSAPVRIAAEQCVWGANPAMSTSALNLRPAT